MHLFVIIVGVASVCLLTLFKHYEIAMTVLFLTVAFDVVHTKYIRAKKRVETYTDMLAKLTLSGAPADSIEEFKHACEGSFGYFEKIIYSRKRGK